MMTPVEQTEDTGVKSISSSDLVPSSRKFDTLLAEKVMGWTKWNDEWYLMREGEQPQWRGENFWSPTHEASAAQLVWIRCLLRAREMGYELSMSVDGDNRYNINGDHPVGKRLLVIDVDPCMVVCRFACLLFELDAPSPYDHDPIGAHAPPESVMEYTVTRGLQPPVARGERRYKLTALIDLAKQMRVGDAVALRLSEAQTFRIILAALGYECVTDGYRCKEPGKTLAFKLVPGK